MNPTYTQLCDLAERTLTDAEVRWGIPVDSASRRMLQLSIVEALIEACNAAYTAGMKGR